MARFKFETCPVKSIEELIHYIDSDWVKNHIFVHSQELLDWQHKDIEGKCYNFILARDVKTGEICGVLGYIFTSHFSLALKENKDVWLAIWKVKEGARYIGLGLKLLGYLKREHKVRTICSIGLSQMVVPMYKALNFNVGQLEQFVLINDRCVNNQILSKGSFQPSVITPNSDYSLDKLTSAQLSKIPNSVSAHIFVTEPKKNNEYIENRFSKHPIYDYDIYSVNFNDEIKGILVVRLIEKEGSKVLRIIDYQGDSKHLSHLNLQFMSLLETHNCEYIDFMQYGITDEILAASGFVNSRDIDGLVVPDYFEPLVKKNMRLDFARLGNSDTFFLCKGDSDQDRPSKL
jgi:hypothetical protein